MAYPTKDHFLAALLDIMADAGFSVDLTLMVKGAIVSGTPISETEYFSSLGDVFAEGFEHVSVQDAPAEIEQQSGQYSRMGTLLREFTVQSGRDTRDARKKRAEKLEILGDFPVDTILTADQLAAWDQLTRAHIYMKDVTILSGSTRLGTLPLWRGRLSEIDGWSAGQYNG